MPIRRVFFDWRRPALRVAAGWLFENCAHAGADLGHVIVAVSGGRVGRRLLEILVELAEQQRRALVPPRIVTAGTLPELLYEVKQPFAGHLVQQLAWIEALRTVDAGGLGSLLPELPERADLPAWLSLGDMLARLHRELAADGLDFEAVSQRGGEVAGFSEHQRWQTLSDLEQRYLRVLDKLGLWDTQIARLHAIRHGECRTDKQIVLLATVDMDGTQRAMLDQIAERVTSLIVAPADMAAGFDAHGCLLPAAWRDVPVVLEASQIEIVEGPAEQADAALRAIAGLDGLYTAEEITIGVPDERVVPYLRERLAEAGLPARYGAGKPLAQSGPVLLLDASADYLEQGQFAGLAQLARHPDVSDYLAARGVDNDCLALLDQYHSEHLPARPTKQWLGTGPGPEGARRVARALGDLLKPLAGKPRPLAQWTEPLRQLLVAVYGRRELDRQAEQDRPVLAAVDALIAALAEFDTIDASLMPTVGAAEALRLALAAVQAERVAPPVEPGAIELLGWLELPLDDAGALVITGFNEGIVPASRNGDLFLPNTLRSALALEDNDRRYARDHYALALLVASRRELRLIAGRRSADGQSLVPSRLLFVCDDDELARRTRSFFSPHERPHPRLVLPHSPRAGQSSLTVPHPRPLAEPVTSMRVTEFRDYLACPYRYYLRHRLKLEALNDQALELDAARFGTLLHCVLERFGGSTLADVTSVDDLRGYLNQMLDEVLAESYGEATLSAVRIQAEQVRLRLMAFANWQAQWRAQGWKIRFSERKVGQQEAPLPVDGEPMYLRGRIDRIDVHETRGDVIVFDYKTGDSAKQPDKVHRLQDQWIDLQLPLYRYLLAALDMRSPVQLGYILLPKDVRQTGESIANWTDAELESADVAAAQVVRQIRLETFWPPAAQAPKFSEDLAAICQDGRIASVASDEEGAEDAG